MTKEDTNKEDTNKEGDESRAICRAICGKCGLVNATFKMRYVTVEDKHPSYNLVCDACGYCGAIVRTQKSPAAIRNALLTAKKAYQLSIAKSASDTEMQKR